MFIPDQWIHFVCSPFSFNKSVLQVSPFLYLKDFALKHGELFCLFNSCDHSRGVKNALSFSYFIITVNIFFTLPRGLSVGPLSAVTPIIRTPLIADNWSRTSREVEVYFMGLAPQSYTYLTRCLVTVTHFVQTKIFQTKIVKKPGKKHGTTGKPIEKIGEGGGGGGVDKNSVGEGGENLIFGWLIYSVLKSKHYFCPIVSKKYILLFFISSRSFGHFYHRVIFPGCLI